MSYCSSIPELYSFQNNKKYNRQCNKYTSRRPISIHSRNIRYVCNFSVVYNQKNSLIIKLLSSRKIKYEPGHKSSNLPEIISDKNKGTAMLFETAARTPLLDGGGDLYFRVFFGNNRTTLPVNL